jgi:hypothetical protein
MRLKMSIITAIAGVSAGGTIYYIAIIGKL